MTGDIEIAALILATGFILGNLFRSHASFPSELAGALKQVTKYIEQKMEKR